MDIFFAVLLLAWLIYLLVFRKQIEASETAWMMRNAETRTMYD
jgi:hypothetical protein